MVYCIYLEVHKTNPATQNAFAYYMLHVHAQIDPAWHTYRILASNFRRLKLSSFQSVLWRVSKFLNFVHRVIFVLTNLYGRDARVYIV